MADDKSKSGGGPGAPSFYSAAAGMEGKKPPPPPPDGGGAGTPAGQSGEKVKNVEVLLEVFQKMDKQEQDPDAKAMIQSMVDTAKKYLDKLKGGESAKGGPAGAPATGEAGSGGGMGNTGAGPEASPMGGGAPGGMAA